MKPVLLFFLALAPIFVEMVFVETVFAETEFTITLVGARSVYPGADLYLATRIVHAPGSVQAHYYFLPSVATDPAITTQYSFGSLIGGWNCGVRKCWYMGNGEALLKITTPLKPGSYSVTVNGEISGVVRSATYAFNVVPLIPKPVAIAKWEQQMLILGKKWCKLPLVMSFGNESEAWYYDGGRVYLQIADFTGDKSWEVCAYHILDQYRDNVIERKGNLQGWRVFPHGLRMAWERTGDVRYKEALLLLSKYSAFIRGGGYGHPSDAYIRENAYIVNTLIEVERVGEPRNPMLARTVDFLLGHFDLYFRVRDGYVQNQTFYDGIAAEALIAYYELTKDARILSAIKLFCDWIWEKGYDRAAGTLIYNADPPGPRCDPLIDGGCQKYTSLMTNLIVPAFAWYWSVTGDFTYRDRGDEIFAHALDTPIDYTAKIFTQNYKWSFVRWRYGL